MWCYTMNNKDFFLFCSFYCFMFLNIVYLIFSQPYFHCQTLFSRVKIWSTLKDIPNVKDRQHCAKRKIMVVFPSL